MCAAAVRAAELNDARFVAQAVLDARAKAWIDIRDQRYALNGISCAGSKHATGGDNDPLIPIRRLWRLNKRIEINGVIDILPHRRHRHDQQRGSRQQPDHAGLTASGCAFWNASNSMHAASIATSRG